MITHSVKETRQHKEHWGWMLEARGEGGQNLKKEGGRQYRWVFIKQEG